MAQELEAHLQLHIDDNLRAGMSPAEARRHALIMLGGIEQVKEMYRDCQALPLIENLIQDLRYGVRTLRKSPGFTAVAVLTLALGIGANTAIFSVVNTVLLRPLPYPEPGRIVQIMLTAPAWNPRGTANVVSPAEFTVLHEQTQNFQDITAYDLAAGAVNLTGGDHPEQLKALHVSANYFRLFGASIEAGRTFSGDEDRPGGPRAVVLSDGLWRRRFGGDRSLVGTPIVLGNEPYVVIGVLGPGFPSDPPVEVWLPLQFDPYSTQGGHSLRAAARLKGGVTLEAAREQMKLASRQFRQKFPDPFGARGAGSHQGFTAEPLHDVVVGDVRPALLVLLGAVSCVLLIACANVANLLLVRAAGRRREMAIRAAFGAGRRRIVSRLLTESLLLSLAGGVLGLGFGSAGVDALTAINPGYIPRIALAGSGILPDWRVLAFTMLVSVLTGVVFGLMPALTTPYIDVSAALNETSRRSSAGHRQNRARAMLVVAETALAFALLLGAALLMRTFVALRGVDPGFDAHNVLTMEMSLSGTPFKKTDIVAQLIREAQRRVESLPGVIAVAATYSLPLEARFGGPFVIDGRPNNEFVARDACFVSTRYFDVFRIRVFRGRAFTERDGGQSPPVVLVNRTIAQGGRAGVGVGPASLLWPNGDPIGNRIFFGRGAAGPPFSDSPLQIIGIADDVNDSGLSRSVEPTLYLPITQLSDATTELFDAGIPITWAIRTRTDPYSLSADIQRELRIASGLPVAHIRSMDEVRTQSTASTNFTLMLLGIFAGVAVVLAAIGIYGVMSYTVGQRAHEIGIRMTLGASGDDVLCLVLHEGLRLALLGIVAGLVAAAWLTRAMKSLLFGVSPTDPLTFAVVGALLLAVAIAATYIAARRATKVDPMAAIRFE
jgi:predicted permease